jgi:glycosyltransferase involved in cell wall biosynthesis
MPAWEAIVVDDASTTDITSMVNAMGDARVRVLRRSVNGGVAAAQNSGLDAARARYVSFLHSDDEWLPERLATLVPILDEAPAEVGGVECGAWIIKPTLTRQVEPRLKGATDADLLGYRAGVHIASLLLRRRVALDLRFDEALRHTEDRDFCIRLLRHTRLAFEPGPLVVVHREQPGLRDLNKAPTCRYLIEKYAADLAGAPRVEALWWARLARLGAAAGDVASARLGIRRAVAVRPGRVRWWPLLATSYLSDRAFGRCFGAYLVSARLRVATRDGLVWRRARRSVPAPGPVRRVTPAESGE